MLKKRSEKLERIDTGDYTAEEYERFLREISFINKYLGDVRALKKTLLQDIEKENPGKFSVLDIGAGSGEFLRVIARFARKQKRKANLVGLELNARSADSILEKSKNFAEINSVRGDALRLPFADKSFDYAVCSLFTHHFSDEKIIEIFSEMKRVSRRKIFVIDLHRHRFAYVSYKIFCTVFRISPLVRQDGALSILRSFTPKDLEKLAQKAEFENFSVKRYFPFRLVLQNSQKSK